MPYSVVSGHPDCSGWAVVKDDGGDLVPGGCHSTEAEAQAHLTALNIAEFGERQVDPTPPEYISQAAARGLELRAEGFGGDGVTDQTVREARDMARGFVTESKMVRAAAWGARHAVDLEAPANSDPNADGWPGPGAVAHYLWGINPLDPVPARSWFERKRDEIQAAADRSYKNDVEVSMKREQLKQVRETRQWGMTNVEVREHGDGKVRFEGYASVFNRDYDVTDRFGSYTERIAPGAFTRTLTSNPDVVLVVNHEGLPLARTKSGTLRLASDDIGLRVEADLDPSDPDVQALLPKFRRGDLDEMSFAFRVNDQQWNDDYSERTITEISLARGDVSIVTFGANPHTLAALRAALADEEVRAQLVAENPDAARILLKDSFVEAEQPAVPDIAPESDPDEDDDDDDGAERIRPAADTVRDNQWESDVFRKLVETKVSPAAVR